MTEPNPYKECTAGCCRTGRADSCWRRLRCACHDVYRERERIRDEWAEYDEYLKRKADQ